MATGELRLRSGGGRLRDSSLRPRGSPLLKKKLSDMLGSQWSKDELERFYGAYRKHGKDWRKIAGAIRDRTSDMVEALYNMNKAYLSLPEGTATAAGLIARMTDHYNILDRNNNDRETNDSPKASRRPQKRGHAKFESAFKTSDADYTDIWQPQPASSSYGRLPLSKKKRSGGIMEGEYVRRIRSKVRWDEWEGSGAANQDETKVVQGAAGSQPQTRLSFGAQTKVSMLEIQESGSSSDDEEEEEFRVEPRQKGVAEPSDSDDNDEANDDEEEEEQHPVRGGRRGDSASYEQDQIYRLQRPQGPLRRTRVDYLTRGMTETCRAERRVDPRKNPRTATDYRFHTLFHQDFYESVILPRTIHRAQWIDWEYMRKKGDPIFNDVIRECERKKVKRIMGLQYNWSDELIAQFYATLYVDESNADQRLWTMSWMTDGEWYNVTYERFSTMLGFNGRDMQRHQIHSKLHLPRPQMKFMYLQNSQGSYGTVKGIYSYYGYLNRMFRATLAPKSGDNENITFYTKNLLAKMEPSAARFSVFHFIWSEIKCISEYPMQSAGYGPYIMKMIEDVIGTSFVKEVVHKPLRIARNKTPILPTDPGASTSTAPPPGDTSSLPQQQSGSHSQHSRGHGRDKPPSPIRKLFNMICGMCRRLDDFDRRAYSEQLYNRAQLDWMAKMIRRAPNAPVPPSPVQQPIPSPPRPLESYQQEWEREDYYSQIYGSGPSSLHGYASHQETGPSTAPPDTGLGFSMPPFTRASTSSGVPYPNSASGLGAAHGTTSGYGIDMGYGTTTRYGTETGYNSVPSYSSGPLEQPQLSESE